MKAEHGAAFVSGVGWGVQTSGHSKSSFSGTSELGYAFFGARGNDHLLLLANILPIIVSTVSALVKVAILPD